MITVALKDGTEAIKMPTDYETMRPLFIAIFAKLVGEIRGVAKIYGVSDQELHEATCMIHEKAGGLAH